MEKTMEMIIQERLEALEEERKFVQSVLNSLNNLNERVEQINASILWGKRTKEDEILLEGYEAAKEAVFKRYLRREYRLAEKRMDQIAEEM